MPEIGRASGESSIQPSALSPRMPNRLHERPYSQRVGLVSTGLASEFDPWHHGFARPGSNDESIRDGNTDPVRRILSAHVRAVSLYGVKGEQVPNAGASNSSFNFISYVEKIGAELSGVLSRQFPLLV